MWQLVSNYHDLQMKPYLKMENKEKKYEIFFSFFFSRSALAETSFQFLDTQEDSISHPVLQVNWGHVTASWAMQSG